MKKSLKYYIILSSLLFIGMFMLVPRTNADTIDYQIITLEPGWNIISTPRVLLNHEFSVPSTIDNFDIYLLDPTSPSSWQTMQGAGQSEFQPLFAYFVNNKTGEDQTLKLNYDFDLTPGQRLFQRTLYAGWNTIGIAEPSYALPQWADDIDTNNPGKILSPIINSIGQIIDFTNGNINQDSPKITETWSSRIPSDVDSLADFRELKGYGVFITNTTNNYIGSQNLEPVGVSALAEVELSTNISNPAERAVIGSVTAATENVELLRFNLEATVNNVIVSGIKATLTDGSNVLQTLKLYDGDILLAATATAGTATSAFTPLNIRVGKDTTKTLTVKGDVRILTEGLVDKVVSIVITTDQITAEDAGTATTITPIGSTATGKSIYAYIAAPSLSLVSASIATTREGRTDGSNTISAISKIKFNVTAMGGNIYIDTPTAGVVATTSNTTAGVETTITSTGASNAEVDTEWLVRQGETKWFEITSLITNSSPTGSFVYMNFDSFSWGTTSATKGSVTWTSTEFTSIPLEFKTGSVYLQGTN